MENLLLFTFQVAEWERYLVIGLTASSIKTIEATPNNNKDTNDLFKVVFESH